MQQGRKIRNPPAGYPPDIHRISAGYPPDIRRISAGGRKDLIRVLTNENRALLLANEMNLHLGICGITSATLAWESMIFAGFLKKGEKRLYIVLVAKEMLNISVKSTTKLLIDWLVYYFQF